MDDKEFGVFLNSKRKVAPVTDSYDTVPRQVLSGIGEAVGAVGEPALDLATGAVGFGANVIASGVHQLYHRNKQIPGLGGGLPKPTEEDTLERMDISSEVISDITTNARNMPRYLLEAANLVRPEEGEEKGQYLTKSGKAIATPINNFFHKIDEVTTGFSNYLRDKGSLSELDRRLIKDTTDVLLLHYAGKTAKKSFGKLSTTAKERWVNRKAKQTERQLTDEKVLTESVKESESLSEATRKAEEAAQKGDVTAYEKAKEQVTKSVRPILDKISGIFFESRADSKALEAVTNRFEAEIDKSHPGFKEIREGKKDTKQQEVPKMDTENLKWTDKEGKERSVTYDKRKANEAKVVTEIFEDLNLPYDVVVEAGKRQKGTAETIVDPTTNKVTIFLPLEEAQSRRGKRHTVEVLAHETMHVASEHLGLADRPEVIKAYQDSGKKLRLPSERKEQSSYRTKNKNDIYEWLADEGAKWVVTRTTTYPTIQSILQNLVNTYRRILAHVQKRKGSEAEQYIPNEVVADLLNAHSRQYRAKSRKEKLPEIEKNLKEAGVKVPEENKAEFLENVETYQRSKPKAKKDAKVADLSKVRQEAEKANFDSELRDRFVNAFEGAELEGFVESIKNLPNKAKAKEKAAAFIASDKIKNGEYAIDTTPTELLLAVKMAKRGDPQFNFLRETYGDLTKEVKKRRKEESRKDAEKKMKEEAKKAEDGRFIRDDVGNILEFADKKEAIAKQRALTEEFMSLVRRVKHGEVYRLEDVKGTIAARQKKKAAERVEKEASDFMANLEALLSERKDPKIFQMSAPPKGGKASIYGGIDMWKWMQEQATANKKTLSRWLEESFSFSPAQAKSVAKFATDMLKEAEKLLDPVDVFKLGNVAVMPKQGGEVWGYAGGKKIPKKDLTNYTRAQTPQALPIFAKEVNALIGNIKEGFLKASDLSVIFDRFEVAHKALRRIGGQFFVDYFWHPMNRQKTGYLRHKNFIEKQLRIWAKSLNINKKSRIRVGRYMYTSMKGGVQRLKQSGHKPLKLEELTEGERRFVEILDRTYEELWPLINEARTLAGKKPLKKPAGEHYLHMLTKIAEEGSLHDHFLPAFSSGKLNPAGLDPLKDTTNQVRGAYRTFFAKEKVREGQTPRHQRMRTEAKEGIVYEIDSLDATFSYINEALWAAYMGPLHAKYKGVLEAAYRAKKISTYTKDAEARKPTLTGDKKERKALVKEIKKLDLYEERVHEGLLDEAKQSYGSKSLSSLDTHQLLDMKQAIMDKQPLNKLPFKEKLDPKGKNIRIQYEYPKVYRYLADYISSVYDNRYANLFARKANPILHQFENLSFLASRNATAAMVMARATTHALQLTAAVPAVAQHPMQLLSGLKGLTLPGIKEALRKSHKLEMRGATPEAMLEEWASPRTTTGITKKTRLALTSGLRVMDFLPASFAWHIGYKHAKSKGMKERTAREYADEFIVDTQTSADMLDVSPVQRNKAGRVLTALQTYTIGHANYMLSNVLGIGSNLPRRTRMLRLLSYGVLTQAIVNPFFRDELDMYAPYPDIMWDMAISLERDGNIPVSMFKGFKATMEYLPVIGGSAKFGGSSVAGPLWNTMIDAAKNLNLEEKYIKADDFGEFLANWFTSKEGRAAMRFAGAPTEQLSYSANAYLRGEDDWMRYLVGYSRKEKTGEPETSELLDNLF